MSCDDESSWFGILVNISVEDNQRWEVSIRIPCPISESLVVRIFRALSENPHIENHIEELDPPVLRLFRGGRDQVCN